MRQAQIAAAAKPFEAALRRWAATYVRRQVIAARSDPRGYGATRKQRLEDLPPDERALAQILLAYGLRRAADVASGEAGSEVLSPRAFSDAIAGKDIKVKVFQDLIDGVAVQASSIARETRDRIRTQIRDVIAGGGTTGEIMAKLAAIRAYEPSASPPEPGRVYVFDWGRAELIARTELTQAENTGIMAGIEAAGVDELEWMAYSDGRSGHRHHERMNGRRWLRGTTIRTPLGNKLRYPGDPLAPIEDTANCRCTFGAATRKPRGGGP